MTRDPEGTDAGLWAAHGISLTGNVVSLIALPLYVLDSAWTQVILPVYADRLHGGAAAFGLLISAMGTGALLGSLAYGAVGHRLPRRAVYAGAFLLAGGTRMLVFAAEPDLLVCLVTVTLAGFAAGTINPIIGTVRLERTPTAMRARVYGAMGAAAWSAMPLGLVLGGLAVDHAGLTATLVTMGIAYLALGSIPLAGGTWASMNRPTPEPGRHHNTPRAARMASTVPSTSSPSPRTTP